MKCEEFQQLALETLSEVPAVPLHNAASEAHLAACQACQGFYSEMRDLIGDLHHHQLPEPGELFFARQRQQIEAELGKSPAAKKPSVKKWYPALAAAAVLLMVLGYAKFFRGPDMNWRSDWPSALSFLAQERNEDDEWLNFDDLSDRDLDIYARAVEAQVRGDEAATPDEVLDIQDLDRQETDLLIKRLEAGLSGKNS